MFWLTYDSENTLGVSAVPLGALCLLIHASCLHHNVCDSSVILLQFPYNVSYLITLWFIFWGRACFAVFACQSHSPVVFFINVISTRSWQCCRLVPVNTDRKIYIVQLWIHTCWTFDIFMSYKSEFPEKGTSLALPAGKNGGRSQLRWCQ